MKIHCVYLLLKQKKITWVKTCFNLKKFKKYFIKAVEFYKDVDEENCYSQYREAEQCIALGDNSQP